MKDPCPFEPLEANARLLMAGVAGGRRGRRIGGVEFAEAEVSLPAFVTVMVPALEVLER